MSISSIESYNLNGASTIASSSKEDCALSGQFPYASGSDNSSSLSRSLPDPHWDTFRSPADVTLDVNHVVNTELISPPSPSRHHRPAALQPVNTRTCSYSTPALFSHSNLLTQQSRRNVPINVLNELPSRDYPDPVQQHGFPRSASIESYQLSSLSSPSNVSINPSKRLRTTAPPVFTSTSALAAHHGIPQSLPPVPRTTRYSQPVPTPAEQSVPIISANDFDFTSLCSNYLTMLSQNPEQQSNVADGPSASADSSPDMQDHTTAVQALLDVLQGTSVYGLAESARNLTFEDSASPYAYLTSPMDESPWDDMLTTPLCDLADSASDMLTSPAIIDAGEFDDYGGLPLFPDGTVSHTDTVKETYSSQPGLRDMSFDGMYRMPSPSTPSLDPASLYASPRVPSTHPSQPPAPKGRNRSAPTGTRKNITPEALVPFDAPIQPRKYVTPSVTSRKEIPATFAKKRARSQAFEDEEDARGPTPSMTEAEAIEAKRRQNTLAARRSRKRKLEHQRDLELGLEALRAENEMLKAKAQSYQMLLARHGIVVPDS